ncbi:MAG: GNAT family N-acetyltransferase [Rhizobiales bacterium]|nr:GNAT family N-acetyltransferase [Hyphomicrobiales bacterium]MBA68567.1 GNAT family N-acetyltransferase [Hyphomicrobiales bacterium]|tara:strand:- start:5218 stop:5769 length:552 start_codon:yes stop_codon:yes gene_type:complete
MAVEIVAETAAHVPAREALLDRQMGPKRRLKSSEKLRRGRLPAEGLALSAVDGEGNLVGTVRLWNVAAGVDVDGTAIPALLLGPLAVDASAEGLGVGSRLMRAAISKARDLGHGAILLVGDAAYYERFGFSAGPTGALAMPGPVERSRFLALELVDDHLAGAAGVLTATGRRMSERQLFSQAA